ncbi:MAG: hypothetical protein ACI89T_000992 [Cognaticolwellia sp.]
MKLKLFFIVLIVSSFIAYLIGYWCGGAIQVSKTFEYCESIGKTISGIDEPAYCIDKTRAH